MTKIFLITFALLYTGEVKETGRIEFPSVGQCHNALIQLQKGTQNKSYAFECREISDEQ